MKPAMNTAYTPICPKRANGVYAHVLPNYKNIKTRREINKLQSKPIIKIRIT